MAGIFSKIAKLFGGGEGSKGGRNGADSPYQIEEVYTGLREQILELSDKDFPGLDGKPVWAVLMEMGRPNAVVTMVAVADGTASLYFSNGGGMIGLGEHDNVRAAALTFIEAAQPHLQHFSKTDTFPLPKPEETYFNVVTPEGVLTYRTTLEELDSQHDKLSPLYFLGQELLTQMRLADERRQAETGGD